MRQKIGVYSLVSFGFSWLIALGIHLAGGFPSLGSWLIAGLFLYMCGPAVAAILCVALFERGRRLEALGLRQPEWREMPWAWIGALFLLLGALLITAAVPGYGLAEPIANNIAVIESSTDLGTARKTSAMAALSAPFMGLTLALSALLLGPAINAVLTLSEELGWRGYLFDQLRPMGFWRISIVTGVLWGVWHMPIIWLGHNYPDAPILGSLAFIGLCTLMSPLYTWVRIKTKSVWGAGLFHGTINGAAGYFILLQTPVEMPWMGLVGIGGYLAAAISVVCVYAVWRRERPSIR